MTSQNLDFGGLPQASSRNGFRLSEIGASIRASGGEKLADGRTGKNGRYQLVALLRQSVFGRLAGYEGVNDAERMCRDAATRWVVGGRAPMGGAASASQMGRFETQSAGPAGEPGCSCGSAWAMDRHRAPATPAEDRRARPGFEREPRARPKATGNAALIRTTSAAPAATCCVRSTRSTSSVIR